MGCVWTINVLRRTLRNSSLGPSEDSQKTDPDCQTLALHFPVQDHVCIAAAGPRPPQHVREGLYRLVAPL